MPRETRNITEADILPLNVWGEQRVAHRKALSERKKNRRLSVGPHATLYFENWDTMYYQVQEMLWIEKGGAAQLPDELAAYNPLIPNGAELNATLMFEIPDEAKRRVILTSLGGVEDHISLSIGGDKIMASYETEVERTKDDGKTSSVHFLHFAVSPDQAAKLRDPAVDAMLRIDHPNYGHAAIIGGAIRAELVGDLA
jgi:Protein of unknown function (DUF3501)